MNLISDKKVKVAVLGCGNMASAIVEGIHQKYPHVTFHTYTPSFTRAKELAIKVGGESHKKLGDIPACEYYLLACKPQQIEDLSLSLKEYLPNDAVSISVLAGTSTEDISRLLENSKVIRIMPNTPALIGDGVHALFASKDVLDSEKREVVELFESVGAVFVFDGEEKIDQITAFSGSGPAYFFEIVRIMSSKLHDLGIDSKVAEQMIMKTMRGSSELMLKSEDSPETLRDKVTSKKGVTYEALKVFKEENLEGIFHKALDSAYERTLELKEGVK